MVELGLFVPPQWSMEAGHWSLCSLSRRSWPVPALEDLVPAKLGKGLCFSASTAGLGLEEARCRGHGLS